MANTSSIYLIVIIPTVLFVILFVLCVLIVRWYLQRRKRSADETSHRSGDDPWLRLKQADVSRINVRSSATGDFRKEDLVTPSDTFKEFPPDFLQLLERYCSAQEKEELLRKQYRLYELSYAELDSRGGTLTIPSLEEDNSLVTFSIPSGSLHGVKLVYLLIMYDTDANDRMTSFSPILECGPFGLQLSRPAELHMYHCVEGSTVAIASKCANEWQIDHHTTSRIHNLTDREILFHIKRLMQYKLTRYECLKHKKTKTALPAVPGQVCLKRMKLAMFGDDVSMMRISFVIDGYTTLTKLVEERNQLKGLRRMSPWHDYFFVINKGPLILEPKILMSLRRASLMYSFNEERVLDSLCDHQDIHVENQNAEIQLFQPSRAESVFVLRRTLLDSGARLESPEEEEEEDDGDEEEEED